jgi:DNA-binding NarL/FixJ family response regulator
LTSTGGEVCGTPIIVYGDLPPSSGAAACNDIAGVLHRGSLTVAQLHATVHAAAAGLRVNSHPDGAGPSPLDSRDLRLVELMADGCCTREIAERMNYSERTVKNIVHDLLVKLRGRTRAQAVAVAARRGVI